MTDVFSKSKRSEVMSHIRSRGNKDTELLLAKLFRKHKVIGWKRHFEIRIQAMVSRSQQKQSKLKFHARPDFVFSKSKLAVFVDGCFWHGCPRHATKPKANRIFWRNKFAQNKARDFLVNRTLRRNGWHVVRIWECSLQKNPNGCLRRIRKHLC